MAQLKRRFHRPFISPTLYSFFSSLDHQAKVCDLAVDQNLWGLYVKLTGEVLNADDQGTNTTWKTVNNGASLSL